MAWCKRNCWPEVLVTGMLLPLKRHTKTSSIASARRHRPSTGAMPLYLMLCFAAILTGAAMPIPFAAGRGASAPQKQERRGESRRRSGNPIIPGWYADPEAHLFGNEYWIYPTYSARYDQQVFMDAFSSKDLVTWTKHPRIFATEDVRWARRALWAPSVIEKGGWYYLFFGANDIQNDAQLGGIGVVRSRRPGGPFTDYLGKPLID